MSPRVANPRAERATAAGPDPRREPFVRRASPDASTEDTDGQERSVSAEEPVPATCVESFSHALPCPFLSLVKTDRRGRRRSGDPGYGGRVRPARSGSARLPPRPGVAAAALAHRRAGLVLHAAGRGPGVVRSSASDARVIRAGRLGPDKAGDDGPSGNSPSDPAPRLPLVTKHGNRIYTPSPPIWPRSPRNTTSPTPPRSLSFGAEWNR